MQSANQSAAPLVLVVDDDEDLRMVIVEVLEAAGFRVIDCDHGAHALAVLRAGARPDLLVVDLMMPVMDGEHLRAAILEDPELSGLRMVFLSAQRRCPPGCQPVYFKPIDSNSLVALVSQNLA